ncbi:DUF5683 domain-containing protein [uncultured Winogradskyella sp.]|uniref:DUF5683 domain-containing protein n=1 Tax=uncultured Winogradskyella sp. TaxID=395353 RepID=UPI0026035E2D|nr:DUF5683 domain-containing protein [uncultured Winogradskyella sp.]
MLNKQLTFLLVCFLFSVFGFSQVQRDSTIDTTIDDLTLDKALLSKREIDPLRPSKAAFYSAILPGLGQAYNKKYWKIPIVLGGITGGILVYDFNNRQYNRYRDAFKRRLAGFRDDEFYGTGLTPVISDDGLIRAQRQFRRNRDIATLITVGIYVLNIIDANVDAHLLQFNVDENLAMRPHFQYNPMEDSSDLGVTVNFKF